MGQIDTATAFTLYNLGTASAATAIGTTDQLFITDISGYADVESVADIFSGSDTTVDGGERILKLQWPAGGGTPVSFRFPTPHRCIAGTTVKGKTDLGNGYFTLRGYIKRG
jgi:hypothetical protein